MAERRVLVVDDEPAMLENCKRLLSRDGYSCLTLSDPSRLRAELAAFQPDALLLDLRMPEFDGMFLLTVALADDESLPVIIMTAYASVDSAVQAIREGAFDYLAKPFKAAQLLVAVERAVRHRELTRENLALRKQVGRVPEKTLIIGSSPAMVTLLDRVERVARSEANVLILGESGTGKELLARAIHERSERAKRPFVPVDCAALPDGLLESELFGYEKGAFTGADSRRIGLIEDANGGTVFLDEIAQLGQGLQAKLLRALEERRIRRLGGSSLIEVDIRLIAATNADLEAAVARGTFREDLYYRLNVVPIEVPPLRVRANDIALLAQHFLARYSAAQDKPPPRLSPDVWGALERHTWPGNVRELKNLIERIVLGDLPESFRPGIGLEEATLDFAARPYEQAREEVLHGFRSVYVDRLLKANDGNITKAARAAGVSRRTVHRWLAEINESKGAPS
jgi:DNA-binding NtrC family response regulator